MGFGPHSKELQIKLSNIGTTVACLLAASCAFSVQAQTATTAAGATAMIKKGIAFIKTNGKGTFWQDYKFTNPTTQKIEPKSMYCEKLDNAARPAYRRACESGTWAENLII